MNTFLSSGKVGNVRVCLGPTESHFSQRLPPNFNLFLSFPLIRIAFLSIRQKWFPCGLPIMSVERWLSVLTQVKPHCKQDCVQRRAAEERGATLKPDDGTSPLSAPASGCWLQTAPSQTPRRPGAPHPPSYQGGNGCWFGCWLVAVESTMHDG